VVFVVWQGTRLALASRGFVVLAEASALGEAWHNGFFAAVVRRQRTF